VGGGKQASQLRGKLLCPRVQLLGLKQLRLQACLLQRKRHRIIVLAPAAIASHG